jgi:hypothetical protein
MNQREYMTHGPSGDIYVMEFAGDSDEPIAMRGPCYYGDLATVKMDDWNLAQDDLEWAAGEAWDVCYSQARLDVYCGYPDTVCECPLPPAAAARWARSKQVAHRKRNRSGHKFDVPPSGWNHVYVDSSKRMHNALQGQWVCTCGLTLYDWQCKWLWS